nr:MAG TPA: hypothetical protein [Caudoviricetes sp.]
MGENCISFTSFCLTLYSTISRMSRTFCRNFIF